MNLDEWFRTPAGIRKEVATLIPMTSPRPLPPKERVRELTADCKLTQEQANQYADLFIDAGNHGIALMFLERSKGTGRLGHVKEAAVKTGDAFL